MFGIPKIYGFSKPDTYVRVADDFYIKFDFNYGLKDIDLNSLGILMTYFNDSYDLFDEEFKKANEYWIKKESQSSPEKIRKYCNYAHQIQKNWNAFKNKWGNINNNWISGQDLLDSVSELLAKGSSVIIPIVIPDNAEISKIETGIFNLTLSEQYNAYALHKVQFSDCVRIASELKPYDENFKNWVKSDPADAIFITSSIRNDRNLENWAISYANALKTNPIIDISAISKYLMSRNDTEYMSSGGTVRDAIIQRQIDRKSGNLKQGFTAHILSPHRNLLEYETIIRDTYINELKAKGKDICNTWGNRYQSGSEELAVLLKQSFSNNIGLYHYYREKIRRRPKSPLQ